MAKKDYSLDKEPANKQRLAEFIMDALQHCGQDQVQHRAPF